MNQQVLILSPEPPYPLHSGGAYRTASLVHYFARIAEVDLILFSESGEPALLPRGLVRSQKVIPLPKHSRSTVARYARNASRAVRGVPPLIDRLSGLGNAISDAIGDRRYDIGVAEHFWCAPYVKQMRSACRSTMLNLHNVESSLHARCALTDTGLQAAGHRRFARASRRLEQRLLPQFDLILAASRDDAITAKQIASEAGVVVYPNALPTVPVPRIAEDANRIVFTGNFEYHPNVDAIRFFVSAIWPLLKQQNPAARVRLVGRGENFVRHLIPPGSDIEMSGSVNDALSEIAQAAVVIAPLRAGSGTRIKILEGWSAARSVVATPIAAEGLRAQDTQNILLAASPEEFAQSVVRLLSDPPLRDQIGRAGRNTFEEHYTWSAVWRTLDYDLRVLYRSVPDGYTE